MNPKMTEYFRIFKECVNSDGEVREALEEQLYDIYFYEFTGEEQLYAEKHWHYHVYPTEELTMTETKTYNNVFENREDYQKLRAFWKQFHADGKHKAVKEEYRTSKPGESGWGNGELAYHKVSPLNSIHHAIYLAAMGKNLKKAFGSMDVRGPNYDVLLNAAWWGKTRIENGMEPNGTAIWNLFEDSIDVKYRLAILQRVNCYLKGHAE